jgi:hypothetical protein
MNRKQECNMRRISSRTLLLLSVVSVVFLIGVGSSRPAAGGQAVMSADAKTWMGDWTLTIEGGR